MGVTAMRNIYRSEEFKERNMSLRPFFKIFLIVFVICFSPYSIFTPVTASNFRTPNSNRPANGRKEKDAAKKKERKERLISALKISLFILALALFVSFVPASAYTSIFKVSMFILVFAFFFSSISNPVSAVTYIMHAESDGNYSSYNALNATAVHTTGATESVTPPVPGNYIFAANWISPSFTVPKNLTGQWNFSVWADVSATNLVSFLYAQIYIHDGTSDTLLATTGNSAQISTAGTLYAWSYTMPPNTHLHTGERIVIKYGLEITGGTQGGRYTTIGWDTATYNSFIQIHMENAIAGTATVNITSKIPVNVTQGQPDVVVFNITLTETAGGLVEVDTLKINLTGNGTDDIIRYSRIFEDENRDYELNPGEKIFSRLSEPIFVVDNLMVFSDASDPYSTLFHVDPFGNTSILVTYDVATAYGADPGDLIGAAIEDGSIVASYGTVSSFPKFESINSTITEINATAPNRIFGATDSGVYMFGNASTARALDDVDGVVWATAAAGDGSRVGEAFKEAATIRLKVLVLDANAYPMDNHEITAWIENDQGVKINKTIITGSDGRGETFWAGYPNATGYPTTFNWAVPNESEFIWGKFTSRKTYYVYLDMDGDNVSDNELPWMAYSMGDTYWGSGSTNAGKPQGHCESKSCIPHTGTAMLNLIAGNEEQVRNAGAMACQDCHGWAEEFGYKDTFVPLSIPGDNQYARVHPRPGADEYVYCTDSNCHGMTLQGATATDLFPIRGYPNIFEDGNYTIFAYENSTSYSNTSWCMECHKDSASGGTAPEFVDGVIPEDNSGHNLDNAPKGVNCKFCHISNFHELLPREAVPAYMPGGNGSYPGKCFMGCHIVQTRHSDVVPCWECHSLKDEAPMHKSDLLPGIRGCGFCHQNTSYVNLTVWDVDYVAPTQVPYPMNHSDDPLAGQKWNKTSTWYWDNSVDTRTEIINSSCYYCHGFIVNSKDAMKRMNAWKGDNTLNSSLEEAHSGNWCASCHFQNYASGTKTYSDMTAKFVAEGLPVPPEITNHTNAPTELPGFVNHSFDLPPQLDSGCFECHGGLAPTATNITEFHFNVDNAWLSASIYVNETAVNSGDIVEVNMTVTNNGNQSYNISPSTLTTTTSGASASPISGPEPPDMILPNDGIPKNFTWTYQMSTVSGGTVKFRGWAENTTAIRSNQYESDAVTVSAGVPEFPLGLLFPIFTSLLIFAAARGSLMDDKR